MEILASFGIAAAVTLLITMLASAETAEAQRPAALLEPPPDVPSSLVAFRAFIELWNNGDVEGAARCFSERAIFRGGPLLPEGGCLGRDSIRAFLGHTAATNIHCELTEGRASPNGSGGRIEIRSDRIHRRGLARIRLSYYAEVRDGEIVLLHMTADANDDETVEYADYVRSLRLMGAEDVLSTPPPSGSAENGRDAEDVIVEGEIVRTYDWPQATPRALGRYDVQPRMVLAAILSGIAVVSMWLAMRRGGGHAAVEPEIEALPPANTEQNDES